MYEIFWGRIGIVAIWGAVVAIAFFKENASGGLIIVLAILALFGSLRIADAGFSTRCSHCKHGDEHDD